MMDPYRLALVLLSVAVVPLFYLSFGMGLAAAIAAYALIARLANRDLDHQLRTHSSQCATRRSLERSLRDLSRSKQRQI
jgi:formate-dependent nitrite reductase membrane component NrfD